MILSALLALYVVLLRLARRGPPIYEKGTKSTRIPPRAASSPANPAQRIAGGSEETARPAKKPRRCAAGLRAKQGTPELPPWCKIEFSVLVPLLVVQAKEGAFYAFDRAEWFAAVNRSVLRSAPAGGPPPGIGQAIRLAAGAELGRRPDSGGAGCRPDVVGGPVSMAKEAVLSRLNTWPRMRDRCFRPLWYNAEAPAMKPINIPTS